MSDPRPLFRQLTSGRVGTTPAATLLATRRAINEGAHDLDDVRARLHSSWLGAGAVGADQALERSSAQLSAADAELGAAVELLGALAEEQDRVTRSATPLIRWWCRAYMLLFGTEPMLMELVSAQVCAALAQLRATHRTELQRIASGFDRLSAGAAGAAPAVAPTDALPPAGTAPQAVARWWQRLSAAQRATLQAQHPNELAELTGLPPTVLDSVNRARVSRDRTVAQAQVETANEGLRARGLVGMPDAQLLGNSDPAIRRLAREHAAAQNLLEHTNQTEGAVRSAEATAATAPPIGPVLLLKYRNTEAGGLAIAFGDPSQAHDVAVAVPGTTAGPGSPSLEQASALRREMDRNDPHGSHATVDWVDYDPPDSIVDADVTNPAPAVEGSGRLVADVAGWRAAAGSTQHVTVIGHSYGSTLVGIAGQHGLAADDIAVVGSPGVGASSASQLSAGSGHVWVGSAEHDPVVQLTKGDWFTADNSAVGPYDKGFGANQFAASNPLYQGGAHSQYYTPGSASLHNLGAIATGDYGQVSALNPADTAVGRGVLGDVVDGGHDFITGNARAAAQLLEGHLDAAGRTAVSAAYELNADALDVVANRLGNVVSALGRFV